MLLLLLKYFFYNLEYYNKLRPVSGEPPIFVSENLVTTIVSSRFSENVTLW